MGTGLVIERLGWKCWCILNIFNGLETYSSLLFPTFPVTVLRFTELSSRVKYFMIRVSSTTCDVRLCKASGRFQLAWGRLRNEWHSAFRPSKRTCLFTPCSCLLNSVYMGSRMVYDPPHESFCRELKQQIPKSEEWVRQLFMSKDWDKIVSRCHNTVLVFTEKQ